MVKMPKQNLLYLFIFATAMGFLEAIVVVYLREIYYPNGFDFPLTITSPRIFFAELSRELCTLIMLLSIALLVGQNSLQRFAYFLYGFAIWDLMYYLGLKIFLDWPSSLLTWDVLFLIPITWVGPVLAPIICSFTMIIYALIILYLQNKKPDAKLHCREWFFLFSGAALIFITFISDYLKIILTHGFLNEFFTVSKNELFLSLISTHVPTYFNWPLFVLGLIVIFFSLFLFIQNPQKKL